MFSFTASSSEIRDALKDQDLQELINKIDQSPDAENVSTLILNCDEVFLYTIVVARVWFFIGKSTTCH